MIAERGWLFGKILVYERADGRWSDLWEEVLERSYNCACDALDGPDDGRKLQNSLHAGE
jgi:hypothetical protein